MKRDIQKLIDKFKYDYKHKKIWKKYISILSFITAFITVYLLITPAMTLTTDKSYTLYLKDSYDYDWKTKENGYTTSYDLKLYFTDILGNTIEGKDITIEIGPNNLADDPYGFGYIPYKSATTTETRGKDLIEFLNLKEHITSTGEKYVFDHAEVYVNDSWQTILETGIRWHLWCQNSSSQTEPANKNYSWKGSYGEDIKYNIDSNTEYKFVYKLVRYGNDKTVISLGADSGIKFKLFNYTGDNDKTGINNNGVFDYFTFRDSSKEISTTINGIVDADGFGDNRAYVEPKLVEGYPIFDCKTKGECTSNPSLGYLFGSNINPIGTTPVGVESYNPINTLLQKENIEGVDYYYYDSNRNAVDYDTDNNRFLVRNYLERGYSLSSYTNESDRYEFLPFDYLTTMETKNHPTSSLTYNYEQIDIDHWYGMTMEFDFYMPADGTINGKDMIFSFSGDDDVWVFIDDVLVLDLGGTHGAVDGNINFKTGEVQGYLNWNGNVGTIEAGTKDLTNIYEMFTKANSTNSVKWNDSNTTFANYTKHTLKFFYLERGAAVANCKIRFNIPVLPSGSLAVQKQYIETDNYNEDYEFTLYDVTGETQIPVANTKYTIGSNEYITDEYGRFTLKSKEEALFRLTNEHTYYVEETNTGEHSISYSCNFDGEDCPEITKTGKFTINPESAYQAVFTNKIKTYDLNISKKAYKETNETFEFQIKLSKSGTPVDIQDDINSKYIVDHTSGIVTFSLKNEESITIKDIPVDTNVILKETKHDGYQTIIKEKDKTLSNSDTYEFIINEEQPKEITVYNIPGVVLPKTGSTGIQKNLIIGTYLIFLSIYVYKYYFGKKYDVK